MLALAACTPPNVQLGSHRLQQGTVYAASLTTSKSGTLHAMYLPKPMRTEKAIFAAVFYERQTPEGPKITEIEIGRARGGYFTQTKLYEEEQKTLYFSVSHDDEQDWMVGFRLRWKF